MAIKIIKQGIKPEERECEGACVYCKTQIEYLGKDGHIEDRCIEPAVEPAITITCPTCRNTIWGRYKAEASSEHNAAVASNPENTTWLPRRR